MVNLNPLSIALGPLFEFGGKLLDRLFPDPSEKARAELEMLRMLQAGDLQTAIEQIKVNAVEASHQSIFVAGWRPFVGWICGLSLFYSAVLFNILAWVARIRGWPAPPMLDNDVLIYMLGGILGLGGYRSIEKVKGKAK